MKRHDVRAAVDILVGSGGPRFREQVHSWGATFKKSQCAPPAAAPACARRRPYPTRSTPSSTPCAAACARPRAGARAAPPPSPRVAQVSRPRQPPAPPLRHSAAFLWTEAALLARPRARAGCGRARAERASAARARAQVRRRPGRRGHLARRPAALPAAERALAADVLHVRRGQAHRARVPVPEPADARGAAAQTLPQRPGLHGALAPVAGLAACWARAGKPRGGHVELAEAPLRLVRCRRRQSGVCLHCAHRMP
jgi:hypothetical protein